MATLIDDSNGKRISYDSLLISNPKIFSVLNSDLAIRVINELSMSPSSTIDIARKLKVSEQNIHYHIKNLERSGIIRIISLEKRYGMVAKIYTLTASAISAKLADRGIEIKESLTGNMPYEAAKFWSPFIEKGLIDSKIIIGDTNVHGKYESRSVDSPFLLDLSMHLGSFVNFNGGNVYKFDTNVTDADLKDNNLIIVGNAKTNSITDRINSLLPIRFDVNTDFRIVSTLTQTKYPYDYDAMILKMESPFNKDKKILVVAGRKSDGLRAAVIALVKHPDEIMKGNVKNKNVIAKVVRGIDTDSDGIVDSVRFYE